MSELPLRIFYNHQIYNIETMSDEPVETLATQIQEIVLMEPRFMTMMVENWHLPLDLQTPISAYGLKPNDVVVVIGSSTVAADPSQKLSEVQLAKIESAAPSKHPVGISNGLNFCYLISAVQLLYATKQVQKRVKDCPIIKPVIQKLKDLFEKLEERTECKISALGVEFAKAYKDFADIKLQYDAQEALLVLENDLQLQDLFRLKTTDEEHQFLGLGIEPEFTTVDDSIRAFLKKSKIIELPKLLQLQFLRYKFDEDTKKVQKLSRKLTFQFNMHLNEFLEAGVTQRNYNLKAIIAHQGLAADQGHYVCFVRHQKKWFLFDDINAQVVDDESVAALAGGAAGGFLTYVALYVLEE